MRVKLTYVLVIFLLTTTSVHAQKTFGDPSCGSWVEGRKELSAKTVGNMSWLMGYITGLSVVSNKNPWKDIDGESIQLWVDKFCQNNPFEKLSGAGVVMLSEILKK